MKERRTWHSWQLVVGLMAALLIGMFIEWAFAGTDTSAASASKTYRLPPDSSSATTSTAPATAAGSATTAPSDTTTSTAPGSGATTAPLGPVAVLIPRTEMRGGPWTSPQFTITGGTWNIGWAYQCTPAPSAGAAFAVFVLTPGQSPTTPALSETQGSGQGITPEQSTGAQVIEVQAPANCIWAVKVSGVGTP